MESDKPAISQVAYGSFNVYEIDGKAWLYDHIAKRFFRYPNRDYLIKQFKVNGTTPG